MISATARCALLILATACHGGGTATDDVPGGGGKADCTSCSSLAPNDRLRVASERETSRWGDGNISTGSAWMVAGRLDSAKPEDLKAAAKDLLTSNYQEDSSDPLVQPTDMMVSDPEDVFVLDLDDSIIRDTAERVSSDGFSYATQNVEGREATYWSLQHVLDWLPTAGSDELAVTATAMGLDVSDEPRKLSTTLFVNTDSREYLLVYVREGTF